MSAVLKEVIPRWPCGTKKSMDNGFRLGFKGVDHGYQPGPAKPPQEVKRQGSRSSRAPNAFGTPGGVIVGMRDGE